MNREQDRGAIVARCRACFFTDNKESGSVGCTVLNGFLDDVESIEFGSKFAPESGCSRGCIFMSKLSSLGGRRDVDNVGVWEVAQNPIATLAKYLRVGVESFDFSPVYGRQQTVIDAQKDLRTDL